MMARFRMLHHSYDGGENDGDTFPVDVEAETEEEASQILVHQILTRVPDPRVHIVKDDYPWTRYCPNCGVQLWLNGECGTCPR